MASFPRLENHRQVELKDARHLCMLNAVKKLNVVNRGLIFYR